MESREALDAIQAARPIAFVAYAEDALGWHHTQDSPVLAADLQRVHEWRRDNDLDLDRAVRATRVADDPFA